MIFRFRIVSDEVANFKREIEIDGSATFLELKNAICDSVGYDKNQMCSFFICNDKWEKEKEITLEDMGFDSDQEVELMEDCELDDELDDEGQKMLFVFDYMTDRCMYMELKGIITGRELMDPLCTLSVGKAPAQVVDLDEFTKKIDDKVTTETPEIEDISDPDMFEDQEFDPSELEGGFEEMNF